MASLVALTEGATYVSIPSAVLIVTLGVLLDTTTLSTTSRYVQEHK
ncbi:MAG: hypothetical protein QXY87_08765 [Saccharolobus sp.]|uniref:Uncharacterized protein n=1 Tax=Saccharolobus shibatae (strain ATCC 51178 / DSM 5389 / JCM 8931 / NBRC 15437 / B12) TaxID=523848 RepID=A0A8F5BMB0_SACSH|nr:hypothetical protein [Saccharolobus shibatae]MCH4815745.1 hypothetical protein [Saccharolobus shibatae]QXJ27790.1 hypothetical protein J5U23_00657 [Saccharolobus shibatae B12]